MVGRRIKFLVIVVVILFGVSLGRPLKSLENNNNNSVIVSSSSGADIYNRTLLEEVTNSGPSPGEGHKQQQQQGQDANYHH